MRKRMYWQNSGNSPGHIRSGISEHCQAMPSEHSPDSPLWTLPASKRQDTAMWRFAQFTAAYHGASADSYQALHAWSLDSPEAFHACLWDFLGIIGDRSKPAYTDNGDIRRVQFYPGARLNYAENLLQNADDRLAIIAHRDDGVRRTLTRRELYAQVSRMAQALQAEGIGTGDRVAAIVTNDIEAVIAYLGCSAIGAIWASCSPDFGPEAASDRLAQVEPKILLAVSKYSYGGKTIDVVPTIKAVAAASAIEKLVILTDNMESTAELDVEAVGLSAFLAPFESSAIQFRRLPYDAPLAILFSSGTTGKPKCIVHSAMGLLIQHKKEMMLHCDIRPNEHFFYFTTCGWMMWNWQVSGLALEATLVTYDGNPFYPEHKRLPDLIDQEKISVFGTSAKYVDACNNFGLEPGASHRLDSLRLILSTGSPLIPASFDYIYQQWKPEVQLASISGGTDICACFLGGNPLLPVHRGELQCAMLGMDIDTLDDLSKPVSGVPGELVCRNAHLSMPLKFWNDKNGQRYQDAYFSRFPGIWAHGDYVEKRDTGGYIIHGRSDTTLNPGGVRIGTAEIYRQVEQMAEIEESIAVGQDWKGDQRVILFVRLAKERVLDDELYDRIKKQIRQGATPRHVPEKIIQVSAIPRTHSGKISELAVRETIHGRPVKNTSALANPESLTLYRNLDALQSQVNQSGKMK
ncbi:MAG: acetoacetate--CoA ligase [Pseudomonadales bacterium]|nr:acetoacetate--CoA ligase [Pseudomonadales bacterium]